MRRQRDGLLIELPQTPPRSIGTGAERSLRSLGQRASGCMAPCIATHGSSIKYLCFLALRQKIGPFPRLLLSLFSLDFGKLAK